MVDTVLTIHWVFHLIFVVSRFHFFHLHKGGQPEKKDPCLGTRVSKVAPETSKVEHFESKRAHKEEHSGLGWGSRPRASGGPLYAHVPRASIMFEAF